MTALPSPAGPRPPDPPESPRTRKKSFADVVSASISPTQPAIPLKKPQTYRGKPAIGITKSEISLLAADYKYALIGKFSHGRPTMNNVRKCFASLGLKGTYTLGSIDSPHLLINLKLEEDYSRLWLRTSLALEGFPMRLFKWTPTFHSTRETQIAPVWITMPFLPVHLFNKNILYSIANLIGKPLKVDEPTSNITRPSLARVCVELDLTRPLVESVWVSETLDEAPDAIRSEGFYQDIQYEYLPAYCAKCYHLGHAVTNCYYGKTQEDQQNSRPSDRNEPSDQELSKNKGKEVQVQEKTVAPPNNNQGLMKDARKRGYEDTRVWRDKRRNKDNSGDADNPSQSVQHVFSNTEEGEASKINDTVEKLSVEQQKHPRHQEDLIHLDEEPLEDQLVNRKRLVVGDKTIEAMMAELIPTAQLQAVCGVQKDSVDVTVQRIAQEEPLEPALDIVFFEDQDNGMQFENNLCMDDQDGQDYALEDEPEAPDRHVEYSRDDLSLLGAKNTGVDMGEMSVHPHTHSRRKSVGDEVIGVEALMGNDDPPRVDNLRRSTRIRKQTFKVRKSPIR